MTNDDPESYDAYFSQYQELGDTSTNPTFLSNATHSWSRSFLSNYGIYLLLLVWSFLAVLALQPSYLFRYDEERRKYSFLYQRYVWVSFVVFGSLCLCMFLWNRYGIPTKKPS